MSETRKKIKEMISEKGESNRRAITVLLDDEMMKKIDKVARAFSQLNESRNFSRNAIIEKAIEVFLEETEQLLQEEFEIDMENEDLDETPVDEDYNLIILPAHNDGFRNTFIVRNRWYAFRIRKDRIPKIEYLALYREAPISGITHYAKVKEIKPYKDSGKYIAYFEGDPIDLGKTIKLGNSNANAFRSPRYTELTRLLDAEELSDLF